MIGLGAELDGPQNARQPGRHVSDDLRWTIINMSVLCEILCLNVSNTISDYDLK